MPVVESLSWQELIGRFPPQTQARDRQRMQFEPCWADVWLRAPRLRGRSHARLRHSAPARRRVGAVKVRHDNAHTLASSSNSIPNICRRDDNATALPARAEWGFGRFLFFWALDLLLKIDGQGIPKLGMGLDQACDVTLILEALTLASA